MRARVLGYVLVLMALAGVPAMAQHGHGGTPERTAHVLIGFNDYDPAHLDVVRGETVHWENTSARRHTVTADDHSFDSDSISAGGTFEHRFTTSGVHGYHCRLHAGIVGDVAVHAALLDAPEAPAAPGRPYPLTGRAALGPGEHVLVEREHAGEFHPLTETQVADDGTFSAEVVPAESARYRVVAGGEASPPVQLLVLDRTVRAWGVRRGRRVVVGTQVSPASPGATVVLQRRLRERFGWWPVRSGKLGAASTARFVLRTRRPVRLRVVLTLADRATRLAVSPDVRLPGRR